LHKSYTINWIQTGKWILGISAGAVFVLLLAIVFAVYISPKEEPVVGALQRIKDRGVLIAALEPNTINYFIYRGEAMGFSLDLLEMFTSRLGVPLKVVAPQSVSGACYLLYHHAIDILAYPVPKTRPGMNIGHFTDTFDESQLVLVQRLKSLRPADTLTRYISGLHDFEQDTVMVQANPFFTPLYDQITGKTGGKAYLKETGLTQEELFRMVSEGRIEYSVCPDVLARILVQVYPNTDIRLAVTPAYPTGWVMNHTSDTLLAMFNQWLDSIKETRKFTRVYRDYFQDSRVVNHFRSGFFSVVNRRISPWDEELRRYSRHFWWDWRLVASLMYEESNFVPGLTSHRNAYGLMQMIPGTAEIYGLDSASSHSEQIFAGIRYLRWIDSQLPAEIRDPRERARFTLAAYNVGIGRVLALRKKAERYGKDPNRWTGNVEYYLLHRSRTDPHGYADTVSLFPVDYATEGYVDKIMSRYYHYLNLLPE
jgi:membrane-bound lytic murein transglycosylase F